MSPCSIPPYIFNYGGHDSGRCTKGDEESDAKGESNDDHQMYKTRVYLRVSKEVVHQISYKFMHNRKGQFQLLV